MGEAPPRANNLSGLSSLNSKAFSMIHYHSPRQSKRYVQGYDPLKPAFVGPGFYHQDLLPSLELHTHDEARVKEVLKQIHYPDGGKINLHIFNLPYNMPEFYN